jgi:hypothetical protein
MNWSSSEMYELTSTEDKCMYKKIYKQNIYIQASQMLS